VNDGGRSEKPLATPYEGGKGSIRENKASNMTGQAFHRNEIKMYTIAASGPTGRPASDPFPITTEKGGAQKTAEGQGDTSKHPRVPAPNRESHDGGRIFS